MRGAACWETFPSHPQSKVSAFHGDIKVAQLSRRQERDDGSGEVGRLGRALGRAESGVKGSSTQRDPEGLVKRRCTVIAEAIWDVHTGQPL